IAADGFAGITRDIGYLNALAHLSFAAIALGDSERAEMLYSLLRPYPHFNTPNGFQYCLGSVSHFLGGLANHLGRTREAVAHYEDALEMNQRIGFAPYLARTQAEFGALLSESPRLSDRARAGVLLADAGAVARKLEMG